MSRWGVNCICAIARTTRYVDWEAIYLDIEGCDPEPSTLTGAWGIMLLFCVVYILISIILLHRVDKDQR